MRQSLQRVHTSVFVAASWVLTVGVVAAQLHSESLAGWTAYVQATETRIERQQRSPSGFLAMDEGLEAAAERRAVLRGEAVVRQVQTLDARGRSIAVPSALVHHWRGAILIPGVTLPRLMHRLETGPPPRQEDVQEWRILEQSPGRMKVFLKLHRSGIVTVVYNTEHDITFGYDAGQKRATSRSLATKIAEVSDPNTPRERELPMGRDRGFPWRLSAYWRYEEVSGGVIAECESISLSRDLPSLLKVVVAPLIDGAARESMERTLWSLRAHLSGGES